MQQDLEKLFRISQHFQIYGELTSVSICKVGHINETWAATYDQGGIRVRYIHQCINSSVFKDPAATMSNVARVTKHIRSKLEAEGASQITRRSLILIPTKTGKDYFVDGENYWRTFIFIEGARTFEAITSTQQAYLVGQSFGRFQSMLADLPGERLHETIAGFHDTRARFQALMQAAEANRFERALGAKAEIDFALKRKKIVGIIVDALAKGKIPERVTHNDTKLNNIMFDVKTDEALCVVDLDTVMPGCALYDFGDMIRTTTNPMPEDEQNLSKVKMSMPAFKKLAAGYHSSAKGFLTPAEKSLMAFSGKLITLELGMRFLTDHLAGDTYFRIHRQNHNLDRARAQFKLVESIEEQEEAMQKFVDSLQ
ncbi:MAG: hypothetical protein JWO73_556 [Candidatus Taylorbacteria bacterium]|nr:hypothetical protein [Candidatus Taylorbacteria bacterium]